MALPVRKSATYQDLCELPPHLVGEIIFGVLHALPRPAPRHARAASVLGSDLGSAFDRGRGGPGGWILLDEPELPGEKAYFDLAPDWVCEILSPSTAALDRCDKRKVYAESRVQHLWLVDPDVQTLEIFSLDGATYRLLEVFSGDAFIRAVPFDAIELELGALWAR